MRTMTTTAVVVVEKVVETRTMTTSLAQRHKPVWVPPVSSTSTSPVSLLEVEVEVVMWELSTAEDLHGAASVTGLSVECPAGMDQRWPSFLSFLSPSLYCSGDYPLRGQRSDLLDNNWRRIREHQGGGSVWGRPRQLSGLLPLLWWEGGFQWLRYRQETTSLLPALLPFLWQFKLLKIRQPTTRNILRLYFYFAFLLYIKPKNSMSLAQQHFSPTGLMPFRPLL